MGGDPCRHICDPRGKKGPTLLHSVSLLRGKERGVGDGREGERRETEGGGERRERVRRGRRDREER